MERRKFILGSAGVLACAAVPAGLAIAAQSGAPRFAADAYGAVLKQPFTVYDSVRGLQVTLVKIKQGKATPGMQQFSLSFAGQAAGALDSGTYDVEHPQLGRQPMYLVAIKSGKDMLYRADFNLLE
jgi:hypothetical protein